jgi:hypothetical protein
MKLRLFLMILLIIENASSSNSTDIESFSKTDQTLIDQAVGVLSFEYSQNTYEEIQSFHHNLTEKKKSQLLHFVNHHCKNQKSYSDSLIDIVLLFALVKDSTVLSNFLDNYTNCQIEEAKAAFEIYFYNIGYEPDKYLNSYLSRLKVINHMDNSILYCCIACDSTAEIINTLNYVKEKIGLDGSGAELWHGVMSWITRTPTSY